MLSTSSKKQKYAEKAKSGPLKNRYFSVEFKFWASHTVAIGWVVFSIILSIPWLNDLSAIVSMPIAIFIIAGISYIPGYINAFNLSSLLLDRQPKLKDINPKDGITILIACLNEENNISKALQYIKNQDYEGNIKVIVVDNGSTDKTLKKTKEAASLLSMPVKIIPEPKSGKHNALNTGLKYVDTEYLITLDADTLLHRSAVRYIVSRMKSAPEDVSAVAGSVLVRNSRQNFITRLQEWDYFLGIASIKRM